MSLSKKLFVRFKTALSVPPGSALLIRCLASFWSTIQIFKQTWKPMKPKRVLLQKVLLLFKSKSLFCVLAVNWTHQLSSCFHLLLPLFSPVVAPSPPPPVLTPFPSPSWRRPSWPPPAHWGSRWRAGGWKGNTLRRTSPLRRLAPPFPSPRSIYSLFPSRSQSLCIPFKCSRYQLPSRTRTRSQTGAAVWLFMNGKGTLKAPVRQRGGDVWRTHFSPGIKKKQLIRVGTWIKADHFDPQQTIQITRSSHTTDTRENDQTAAFAWSEELEYVFIQWTKDRWFEYFCSHADCLAGNVCHLPHRRQHEPVSRVTHLSVSRVLPRNLSWGNLGRNGFAVQNTYEPVYIQPLYLIVWRSRHVCMNATAQIRTETYIAWLNDEEIRGSNTIFLV